MDDFKSGKNQSSTLTSDEYSVPLQNQLFEMKGSEREKVSSDQKKTRETSVPPSNPKSEKGSTGKEVKYVKTDNSTPSKQQMSSVNEYLYPKSLKQTKHGVERETDFKSGQTDHLKKSIKTDSLKKKNFKLAKNEYNYNNEALKTYYESEKEAEKSKSVNKTTEDVNWSRTLYTLLPSQTLYNKKKSCSYSLSSEVAESAISIEILKELSFSEHRKRSAVRSQVSYNNKQTVSKYEEETDFVKIAVEDDIAPDEEETQWEQLSALRGLPVSIELKRKYRASILHASVVPAKGIVAWELKQQQVKLKIKESCKEFLKKIHVWSGSLKVIEGHFGTGVVSYFIFLRWLFFLNLFTFFIFFFFIVLPQAIFPVLQLRKNITIAPKTGLSETVNFSELPFMKQEYQESHNTYYAPVDSSNMPFKALDLGGKSNIDDSYLKSLGSLLETYAVPNILDVTLHYRQSNLTNEERHNISRYCFSNYSTQLKLSTHKASVGAVIQDFLQGTGWMEPTLMFTGFYQPADLIVSGTGISYNLPVAFLVVLLFLCIFCLIMMMSYASEGLREMLLTAESSVQKYCNMIFCGWDYCIEDAKTAVLKQNSIVQELKSNLAEARRLNERAQWTTLQKVKVYSIRSAVHIAVITALVGAGYIIYYVTNYQLQFARHQNVEGFLALFVQFLPSVTITALNFIMPVIFMILIKYERYSSQGEINMSLVRTVFLRLSSVIILVSSFYRQVTCEPKNMCGEGLHQCKSPMCWMTYFGQQMYKLVIMDLFVVIGITFLWEVPRNFLVQRFRCKITDLLGRQTFDIPSQVLGLVYSQTLCWLGIFYSPLLPAVCVIKVYILFYIKKFTLLVNCIPSNNPYRASRSNAIFMVVLMLSFFITIAVLGYSISEIQPSPGCSPFRHYDYMFDAVRDAMNTWSPQLSGFFRFLFSAAFGIPAIILLCLAIYYYSTVSAAHSHMAKVLKDQLILEGRDKQFLLSRLTEVARHKGTVAAS